MSLMPAFEIGLWNAWIPMLYLFLTFPVFIRLAKDRAPDHKSDLADMSGGRKTTCFSSKLIFVPALIYSVFLPLKLGTMWFYVGLPFTLLGLVAYTAVLVNWAGTPPGKPVTSGLYRYSRNPMYVAAFLVFLGISIASASWLFLLFTIIITAGCVLFADLEEKGCLKQYGEIYRQYVDRTPRWIGRLKLNKN